MHELLKTKDRILTSQRDHARKARAELGPAPLTFLFVTESPLERHGDFALTCGLRVGKLETEIIRYLVEVGFRALGDFKREH